MASTVTKTIKAAAGDYSSLSGFDAGEQADITLATGNDTIVVADCYGFVDSTACVIVGWTTAVGNYIYLKAATGEGHSGVWDGSKYNLTLAGTPFVSHEDFLRLEGLQFSVTGATSAHAVSVTTASAVNAIWMSKLLIRGVGGNTQTGNGIIIGDADAIVKIWNTIIYNISTRSSTSAVGISVTNCVSTEIYSTTVLGGWRGIRRVAGTVTAKNCYAGDSLGGDYNGTIGQTTCAASDATGSAGLDNIAVDTDTFTNVTGGSEDFHLPDTDSPLYEVGTDTSGDGAPLDFTDDIDGEERKVTWDVGADELVSIDTELVVADATHALSTDAIALFQAHTLAMSEANHTLSSDAIALFQAHTLAMNEATHALSSDAIALFQAQTLAVPEALHGLSSDAIALFQAQTLAINAALHALSAGSPTLVQQYLLAVSDALHALTADSPVLDLVSILLAVEDALHALTSDSPVLTQAQVLAINEALLALLSDNVTLVPEGFVQVAFPYPGKEKFNYPGKSKFEYAKNKTFNKTTGKA